MFLTRVLPLLILSFYVINGFMDTDLVLSFLKHKQLSHNTILTCSNKNVRMNLAKTLTKSKNILVSIKPIKYLNLLNTVTTKYKRVGIILDGDCIEAEGLLLRCKRYRCFDTKHFWLILYHLKTYQHLFKHVSLNVDCNVKVAYPNTSLTPFTNSSMYLVDDVYNPFYERGGKLQTLRVGYYNKKEGYHVEELQNKYFVRRNLTGVLFKTMVVLPQRIKGTLERYLRNDKEKTVNIFDRFHSRLMHYCKDYYNFSMKIEVGQSWGYRKLDGTMDGLVRALARQKIDFGLSPLLVTPERRKFISYGRKTWNLRAAFILRNPKSRKSYELFVKPLSVQVWVCIVMSSIISVWSQILTYGLDKKRFKTASVEPTLSYTTVCTFGAFCQQGIVSNPTLFCGRISAFFTLLLGSLVYQFYSASLVSFLLNVPTTMIVGVQGIFDNKFNVGCEDVLYFKDYLKYSTDNVTKELYRRLLTFNNNYSGFLKPEEGLNNVKTGGYAFHVELATGYPIIKKYFNEKTICDLKEVPLFSVRAMHANYPKQSSFKDMMDVCLQRLSENGIINRETIFWHPKKPECMRSGATISINTGLEDFYPALFVLIIGIILSLQILGIEVLWHHKISRARVKLDVQETLFPFSN